MTWDKTWEQMSETEKARAQALDCWLRVRRARSDCWSAASALEDGRRILKSYAADVARFAPELSPKLKDIRRELYDMEMALYKKADKMDPQPLFGGIVRDDVMTDDESEVI